VAKVPRELPVHQTRLGTAGACLHGDGGVETPVTPPRDRAARVPLQDHSDDQLLGV
jgi:hypothetical protein